MDKPMRGCHDPHHPFSRFPTAYGRGGRSLGEPPIGLEVYPRGSAVILSITPSDLRRRIILANRALNPSTLSHIKAASPIFCHPSREAEPSFDGPISLGVLLRTAGRRGLFVPVTPLEWLKEDDTRKLRDLIRRGLIVGRAEPERLLEELGVEVLEHVRFAGNVGLRLRDPLLGATYDVVIDNSLNILKTNICLHTPLILYELVLLARVRGQIHTYEPLW